MKNLIVLVAFLAFLVACQSSQVRPEQTLASPVDSLVNAWNTGWANHDSTAIKSMFAEGSVMVGDGNPKETKEKIYQWIGRNMPAVRKIETQKLHDWVSGDRAGFVGTYLLTGVAQDTINFSETGSFTVVWKKESNQWKIAHTHIDSN